MFYSRALAWCTSRICSVSLIAVVCLLYLAFWHGQHSSNSTKRPVYGRTDTITHAQTAFVCYTLFVHTIALLFPFRLCWGTASITRSIKKVLRQQTPPQYPAHHSANGGRKHDLHHSTAIEMEHNVNKQNVLHAIILPNYKEDIDTLRETLDVLACHPQSASSYDVSSI